MEQKIELGAKVQVMNRTTQGKLIVEGYATIKGMDYREMNNEIYCSVLFEGDDAPVYRWVSRKVVRL